MSPPESSAKGGKGKEKGGTKGKKGGGGGGASGNAAVDVSRLNFKIGRILSVEQHPDADSLYVEQGECLCLVIVWYTYPVLMSTHKKTCMQNTSLMWTPKKVSLLVRCPDFRGCNVYTQIGFLGLAKVSCLYFMVSLI